jgi:hypothetical protein
VLDTGRKSGKATVTKQLQDALQARKDASDDLPVGRRARVRRSEGMAAMMRRLQGQP